MKVKISAVTPVLNEVDFIGFSLMAALPYLHEFVYLLDEKSNDGTRELLCHVKQKYAHEKLVVLDHPHFHPHNMALYNGSFNRGIAEMTGDAAMFLHPDMLITEGPQDGVPEGAMAWWTEMTSYAGDFQTVITKGRCTKWKNIQAKKMGLHYFGGYGSQNEDFYNSEITGRSYKHFGSEFSKYPYPVKSSGIKINHYCEVKEYDRRLEKMKLCLKTLHPTFTDDKIHELALVHPRVTLQDTGNQFGHFEFGTLLNPIPEVLIRYRDEFGAFKKTKEAVHA